jgi:exodeoxyribonuclease V alpha subunit
MVSSRELIYTGITRARSALTLVSKSPAAFFEGIAQTARRSSGLHDLLRAESGASLRQAPSRS